MASYNKSTPGYFPDYCNRRTHGVSGTGAPFDETVVIVSNPMDWMDSISGFTNPEWRNQVRRGASATTVMTANKMAVTNASKCFTDIRTKPVTGFPGTWTSSEYTGYPLYAIPNSSTVPSDILSTVRNIALAKFLKRANQVRSGTQYGETLGEWKETVRAITNPLSSLRTFVRDHVLSSKKKLRRLKQSRRIKHLRAQSGYEGLAQAVAGTHLEFALGWVPLVKSTNEAVIELLDRNNRPSTTIVSGAGGRDFDADDSESTFFTTFNLRVYRTVRNHTNYSHKYRACIETGVPEGGTRTVSQSLGLLPENWIPTIWELIPKSFVIDYFVNIGDIIAAMSFRRSSIQWGTSTSKTRVIRRYSDLIVRDIAPPGYWNVSRQLLRKDAWGGGATTERTTVDRTDILTANLLPDLTFHMPYSNKAWANIGALLTSKFCSVADSFPNINRR